MSNLCHAIITLENETGHKILSAQLIHKYSDIYIDILKWEHIDNAQTIKNLQPVEYHTGFLAIGKDWWQVTWISDDGEIHITVPNNFTEVEKLLKQAKSETYIYGTKSATEAIEAVTKTLKNDADTHGFKKHILKNKDNNKVTKIILYDNKTLVINSPSGHSQTFYQ